MAWSVTSGRLIIPFLALFGVLSAPSAAKAWDFYDVVDSGDSLNYNIYGVDSGTGEKTLLTTKEFPDGYSNSGIHVDG